MRAHVNSKQVHQCIISPASRFFQASSPTTKRNQIISTLHSTTCTTGTITKAKSPLHQTTKKYNTSSIIQGNQRPLIHPVQPLIGPPVQKGIPVILSINQSINHSSPLPQNLQIMHKNGVSTALHCTALHCTCTKQKKKHKKDSFSG